MRERPVLELGLLLLLGLAIRLLFAPAPGHVVDVNTADQWALDAAAVPLNAAYQQTNMNYPPASLWFFELVGRAYRAFVTDDPDRALLRAIVKLPEIVFDIIGGGVTYVLARRFVAHRLALAAAAIFVLNPAVIYDSAYWGQNDTVTSVSALAALACLVAGRREAAWLLLAFAILNKPPVAVLGPLLAIEPFLAAGAERRRRLIQTATGIGGALILAYAISVPFYADAAVPAVFGRLLSWYQIGSALYPYTSANAFNIYGLFGQFFAPDSVTVLGLSLHTWGSLLFFGALALIVRRYVRARRDVALVEAAFLTMLAFFLFLTEMHERYLIYALTIVPVLAVLNRRYLWSAGILTLTQWLNLEYSINYMWIASAKPPGLDSNGFAPVLSRLCAAANLAVFCVDLGADEPAVTAA